MVLLEGWAREGLTEEQIAHNIGISTVTLWEWKKKYSKIANALKKGKEVIDFEVENSLLKAAMGYDYVEEVIYYNVDPETGFLVESGKKKFKKHAQPNPTALIFWLKNRKKTQWRDKVAGVSDDNITLEVGSLNESKSTE